MPDLTKRLDAAYKQYREANEEIVHLSIHMLCQEVREAFPKAKVATLDWSDQGHFLMLREVDEADDDDLFDNVDDTLVSNLDEGNESTWGPYVQRVAGFFDLDIDAALARSGAFLFHPESDPDAVEEWLVS